MATASVNPSVRVTTPAAPYGGFRLIGKAHSMTLWQLDITTEFTPQRIIRRLVDAMGFSRCVCEIASRLVKKNRCSKLCA